jgi:RNA polymerase sigma factor (sigma-70 family)
MDKLQKSPSALIVESQTLSKMEEKDKALAQACNELYLTYGPQLIRYVMALGQLDSEMADQIVSNVFIHIWEKGMTTRIREMEKPQSYLYTAVHNRYRDYKKKTERERKKSTAYMVGMADYQDETFSEQFSTRGRIAVAMNGLTDQQRLAVVFTRVEGKSHEEAAAEMGISASTVKKHLKAALSKLRKSLKDLYTFVVLLSLLLY